MEKTSIEEFFNLATAEKSTNTNDNIDNIIENDNDILDANTDTETVVIKHETVVKTKSDLVAEADKIYQSLTTAEKISNSLPEVTGLEAHDTDMDSIAKKAMNTFDDLMALGGNVADMHASKIYEVAGQMLKTALDAKNAKADKKLRMIELQLKKVRLEQLEPNYQGVKTVGVEFDRNELLKYIAGRSLPPT